MNKRLSKYAHSHEQYTVTELDSKDFSSRTTNKDGRVVCLVVDPPPYAGMLSHAPKILPPTQIAGISFASFNQSAECFFVLGKLAWQAEFEWGQALHWSISILDVC